MKNFTLGILTSNRVAMALLTVLAIGAVSCKTSPARQKSTGAANQPPAETAAGTNATTGYYTCGMHPEVRSLDPDGKCPFCQMVLLPAENFSVTDPDTGKTYSAATFPAVSGYYSCPADITVLSKNPNDKCPICGRALLPVESPVFHQHK